MSRGTAASALLDERLDQSFEAAGIVGEKINRLAAYLTATTRLQEFLGHASRETTAIYTEMRVEALRKRTQSLGVDRRAHPAAGALSRGMGLGQGAFAGEQFAGIGLSSLIHSFSGRSLGIPGSGCEFRSLCSTEARERVQIDLFPLGSLLWERDVIRRLRFAGYHQPNVFGL